MKLLNALKLFKVDYKPLSCNPLIKGDFFFNNILQRFDKMILKTSSQWCREFECVVVDPDGWDRKNYEYSFEQELITEEEFRKRVSKSTMLILGKLKNRIR